MEIGVEVWLKDKNQTWVPALVHSKDPTDNGRMLIRVKSFYGHEAEFSVEEENEDIADLKLRNDDSEAQVENLINLPYLHEPAILHCLEQRYNKSDIYTYTGPILIAMNPFKSVPLYTNQILEVYYNMGLLKSQGIEGGAPLPPHVYAIADAAYREMMNTIMQGYGTTASFSGKGSTASANHAILISGESGAGKTESTKIVLRYLTTVGSSSGGLGAATGSVMEKVLQSNPILEAFGNAKTIRNDNSSRFGKYIELNFNKRGHLIGGTISTYLLEKVRLPVQQNGERNFHIFYQILSGATLDEYKKWQLLSFEEFRYTSQGGVYSLKHIDDKQEYLELKKALTTLNFTESDQVELLDIVAGLLHFGQLQFIHEEDGEGSRISANVLTQNSLALTSQLCGLDVDELVRALTVRKIVARSESYEIRLSPIQASDARDAFCKAIYGRIFEWIVVTINRSIQIDEKLVRANIGVLDIFGFECFEYNSFEQLCINYTNETLQQQFNQYIFKMEQIEYKNEQIEWSFIEFPDNQDCLDLIEHKVTGILAMIDDECRLPKASDERLAGRMYKSYENNSRFTATAPHKRDYKFCINHYAGSVVYSTITFVDKNRDELPKEASNLLGKSCNSLISGIFALKQSNGKTLTNNKAVVPTAASASVGTQFKEQLHKLMEKIYTTMPHYIRCLKPNDQNVPDNFDRFRITEQLRYGGVLEAVRVARSGFPVRLNHLDFYARYRPLANPLSSQTSTLPMFLTKKILDSKKQSIKEYCEKLLEAIWDTTDTAPSEKYNGRRKSIAEDIKMWKSKVEVNLQSIQLGLTKVFLRKTAHDLLEGRRSRRILSAVRRIQSIFRRYIIRSWYCKVLESTALLQRVTRGMIARKLAMSVKNKYAATKLQTAFRMYFWRKRYFRIHHAILLLQSMHRRKKSSRLVVAIRLQFQSTRLQRLFRGLLRRKIWRSFRWALIILQNRWRKCMAKALYRKMRLEAKDVGRLQQSNEALKNEIEKLKAKASEDARNLQLKLEREAQQHASVAKNHEIDSLKVEVKELNEKLLIEKHTSRDLETQLRETEKELARCKQELTEAYARIDFLEASGFRGTEAVSMVSKGISSPLDSSPRSRKKFVLDTASPLVEPKDGNNDDSSLPDGLDPNRRISASLNSSSAVHDFEAQYHKALKDLENEITAKEILEEEVSRLRHLSMDLKAQIDSSRRPSIQKKDEVLSPTRRSSTNSEASKNVLDKTLHRRPSANPKSLSSLQKLADQSLWSSTWDEGDDSSVSRSMMSSSTSDELESRKAQVVSDSKNLSRNQPEMVRTVNAFEKNLESFRHKLKHGVRALVWEGQKVASADVNFKLDDSHRLLVFEASQNRRFALFQIRVEITPISVSDIVECIPGAEVRSESSAMDQSLLLTIVTKEDGRGSRILALKFASRDLRNSVLTGLRTLMADLHMTASSKIATVTIQDKFGMSTNPISRKASFNTGASVGINTLQRPTRRLSVRDNVLEENIAGTIQSSTAATENSSGAVPTQNKEKEEELSDLKKQLMNERANYEKMMLQMLVLTNDLNDRDEQIILLKKKEQHYEQTLIDRDNMYKQDAMVRMQLGKRLEQVLMDKEEALEQLEMMKDQLDSIRESFATSTLGR